MNHNYESVKETMITQGIDVPESYIERAVEELGFEKFPEVGLSDIGLSKLVKTATDIYHSDVDLTPRKSTHWASLETLVIKEDLKKVGRGIIKTITYPILNPFIYPTIRRKAMDSWYDSPPFLATGGFIAITLGGYMSLYRMNPKLILPIALTQVVTNLASKVYEHIKQVKNEAEEKEEEQEKCFKENDCRKCPNLKCPHLTIKKSKEIETSQRKSSIKNPICF
jgi:hypothetical protein